MAFRFKLVAGVAAFASLISAGQAQAACWTSAEAMAAGVQNLQMMLLVSSLRCRTKDQGILNSYNSFVVEQRPLLEAANSSVKTHFRGNLDLYDSHTTSLANSFGGGVEGLGCVDVHRVISDAREAQSQWGLAKLADRVGLAPRLSGGMCTITAARQ